MGSGARLKLIKTRYKHLTWKRHILGFHLSKEEMATAELDLLERHINHPLCINSIVASSSRDPAYSQMSLERLKESARSTRIEMVSPDGEIVNVERESIDQYLLEGYRANQNALQIMNHRTKQRALVSSKTITIFWRVLREQDWEYGYCQDYETINARQLTDSTGFRAKYKTIFSHLEPIGL